MTLSLANNVGALNAQHNLGRASNKLNTSIERLSSGLKVNRGADGPAALVISEKQRAQISGLRAAIDNTEKAVSVVQTAEGALNEINSLLVKVRSLAIDSANAGVNDEDALAANQAEIKNALETIDRIAGNTQFGEKKLLDGSVAGVSVTAADADVTVTTNPTTTVVGEFAIDVTQLATTATVGAGTDQTAVLNANEELTITDADGNDTAVALLAGDTQAQVVDKINAVTDTTGVVASIDTGTLTFTSNQIGSAGSFEVVSDVAAAANQTGVGTTALEADGLDIEGTIGGEAATGVGQTLTSTAGDALGAVLEITATATGSQGDLVVADSSLVFQIGANKDQTVKIGIQSVASTGLGIGVTDNQFADLSAIDITTATGAQDALGVLDASIDEISNLRGTLGAFQANTLESTANNLRATLENTVNAESVIRDTDFAEEISNFTNNQVLVQAGTSVLSSANQSSQLILSLLG